MFSRELRVGAQKPKNFATEVIEWMFNDFHECAWRRIAGGFMHCRAAFAGVSFRPVEGNTGTNATDVFVRQDGSAGYVAAFNYNASSVTKNLNLSRLGISGTYTAKDLWDRTFSSITGTNWNVNLGGRQAKLFRLIPTAPTSTNLTATLNAGLLTVTWPEDHAGWRLQTQAVLTASGSGWSDVAGSRQTNSWSISLNQSSPSLFFRLTWT